MKPRIDSRRIRLGQQGAVIVELALLLPLIMMMLVGTITSAIVYSEQLNISHATREAARYGATLPDNQYGTAAGSSWASAVATVATNRASGDLGVSGATICVALVTGNPPAVFNPVGGSAYYYSSAGGTAGPCFTDGNTDSARRVQISVSRPGRIEAVLYSKSVTLRSQADAQFEFS